MSERPLVDRIQSFRKTAVPFSELPAAYDTADRLLAEASQALREQEDALTEELTNRDAAYETLDNLAYTIAPQSVIGEHSSLNDPWTNALDEAVNLRERAERAEARIAELEGEWEQVGWLANPVGWPGRVFTPMESQVAFTSREPVYRRGTQMKSLLFDDPPETQNETTQ